MLGLLLLSLLPLAFPLAAAQCPAFLAQSDACTCSAFTDGAVIQCTGNDGPAMVEQLKAFPLVIRELIIQDANIVEIGPRAFRNLQVKNLKLDHNKVARIDPDAFKGLENSMVSLSIAHNKLTEVPTDALTGMRALNVLNLRCNDIGNIFGSIFRNMSSLIELNLGCNHICDMQGPALEEVKDTLQSLVLDHNCFKSIPGASLSGLKPICDDRNGPPVSDEYLRVFEREMAIEKCRDELFRNVPDIALIGLHMEFNELVNVTAEDMTEMEGLLILRLSGNRLRAFPNNASHILPNLRYLYLDQNDITNIEPNTFQTYKQLEILDLSYNQIAEIAANAFKSIETLTQLKLQGNTIRDIGPNAFANTPLLLLLLSDNCLTSISRPMFQGIPFLRQLTLSGNGVRQVQPFSFSHLPNLHILDLSGNRITVLEANAVLASAHVTVLLQENPLACTSAAYHIVQGGQPIHLLSEPNLICLRNASRDLPFLCPTTRPRPSPPPCCTAFVHTTLPPTTTPLPAPALVYSTVIPPPRRPGGRAVNKINPRIPTNPPTPVPGVTSRTSINMERFWRLQNKASIAQFRRPTNQESPLTPEEHQRLANRIRRPTINNNRPAEDEDAFAPVQRVVEELPVAPSRINPENFENEGELPAAVVGVPRVHIPPPQVPPTAVNPNPSPEVLVDPSGNVVSGQPRTVEVAEEFVLNAGAQEGPPEKEIVWPAAAGSEVFPDFARQQPRTLPRRPPPTFNFPPPEDLEVEPPEELDFRPDTDFTGEFQLSAAPVLPPSSGQPPSPVQSGTQEFFTFQKRPRSQQQQPILLPPGVNHNDLNPLLMRNGQIREEAPRGTPDHPERNIQNTPEEVEVAEGTSEQQVPEEFQGFEQLPPWMQERLRRLSALQREKTVEAPPKVEPPPQSPTKITPNNLPLKPFVAGSKDFFHQNRKAGEFNVDVGTETIVRAESELRVGDGGHFV